jgi:hypothetical protein
MGAPADGGLREATPAAWRKPSPHAPPFHIKPLAERRPRPGFAVVRDVRADARKGSSPPYPSFFDPEIYSRAAVRGRGCGIEHDHDTPTEHNHLVGMRLILTGMPRLLSDILREVVANSSAVGAVEEVGRSGDLSAAVDEANANFVIAGSRRGTLPGACKALMERLPGLTVLAVSLEGRQGWLYRTASACRPVPDLSPVAVRSMVSTEFSARYRARNRQLTEKGFPQ